MNVQPKQKELISKTSDKVLYILHHNEGSRNSDEVLTLALWYVFHPGAFQQVDGEWFVRAKSIVSSLPGQESIGRCRRKFQQHGYYSPTDPVVLARRTKEENIRTTINTNEWDKHL